MINVIDKNKGTTV